jgi:hypothetical protein
VLLTPLYNQLFFRISSRIIRHTVFYKEIWLGCTRHSDVVDTAVSCTRGVNDTFKGTLPYVRILLWSLFKSWGGGGLQENTINALKCETKYSKYCFKIATVLLFCVRFLFVWQLSTWIDFTMGEIKPYKTNRCQTILFHDLIWAHSPDVTNFMPANFLYLKNDG